MLKGAVLRYLVSDALSLTGNSIAGVVLPLVLLARTGDALAAGSLALICAIPQFICGILGGALLDRANRKVVCVASDLISAAGVALLPIVDGIWGLSFGWFIALGLLGAVGSLAYTALSGRLSRRAWFVISLLGMGVGAVGMGLLPDTPLLLASAAMLGLFAGPMSALPGDASPARREHAIGAGMAFLEKIADCMDPGNRLRPDKDYEHMLENMTMMHYNDAQIAASDELFLRFTRLLAKRTDG